MRLILDNPNLVFNAKKSNVGGSLPIWKLKNFTIFSVRNPFYDFFYIKIWEKFIGRGINHNNFTEKKSTEAQ